MNVRHLSFLLAMVHVFLHVVPVTSSLIRQPGNFTIAAFLPVYRSAGTTSRVCSNQFDLKRVVETEAMVYAVNKVNSNPDLLNGTILGYDIEDTCGENPEDIINKVTTLRKRYKKVNKPLAFVIDLPELLSQLVAFYKAQDIPVLSLDEVPSQNAKGNIFYLVPSQSRLLNALVKLIQKLEWTLLDVLVENEGDYQLFVDSIQGVKICVNNVFHAEQNSSKVLLTQHSKVPLLIFSNTYQVFKKLPTSFLEGREILLASDSILDMNTNQSDMYSLQILAVQQKPAELHDFEEYLRKSVNNNESWLGERLRSQNCSGDGNDGCFSAVMHRLSKELRYATKAIDAVYVVAHALNKASSGQLAVEDLSEVPEITSPTGNPIRFTTNKHLFEVDYEVYNLAKTGMNSLGKVKTFPETSDTVVEIDLDKLDWKSKTERYANSSCMVSCPSGVVPVPTTGRLSKCCVTCPEANATVCGEGRRLDKEEKKCVVVRLDYLRWRHPVSLIIIILVVLFFCILVYLVNVYIRKTHTATISASHLATVPLLLSLFVTLILPLLPILKPSTTTCNAYSFGFIQGLGIPLCILISRSHSVYQRFRQEDGTLKKKLLGSDPQNVIAVFLIVIQLVLSIIFLAILPARVLYFTTDDPSVDYIECSIFSRGEFLFPFFFVILLSIIFSIKNFGAVTREEDTYESHFAAISIFGFFFLSFLLLVVLFGVPHSKVKIALLCVVSFLYVVNYLMFIFFPKIYVVIFKRDPSSFSPFPLMSVEQLVFHIEDSVKDDQPSS